jgi:AraC-like DNA-binding protein
VRHVEFFDIDHFENNYHRVKPVAALEGFIDFFWETKFDELLAKHPKGFSDALFPNIGYTYLINLGTPFTMQVADKYFDMKADGFLPRNNAIECYHRTGNRLFGIKFKISPVIFEKQINFSEYKEYIFPLSYLMNPSVIQAVKNAASFQERLVILNRYFEEILLKYEGSLRPVKVVTAILEQCNRANNFAVPIEKLAEQFEVSTRTLQRYFERVTSQTSKDALQVMRVRKAAHHIATSPGTFHYSMYGYYDHSHFYKHLKSFLAKDTLAAVQPHLKLLQFLHK